SLQGEIAKSTAKLGGLRNAIISSKNATDKAKLEAELGGEEAARIARGKQLKERKERTHSQEGSNGYFWLQAPPFPIDRTVKEGRQKWRVLNSDFRDRINQGAVKPSDPIIKLGDTDGPWEIELKIPQKHIGQVLNAFQYLDTNELDVDLSLR